jgi:hypothetical protein
LARRRDRHVTDRKSIWVTSVDPGDSLTMAATLIQPPQNHRSVVSFPPSVQSAARLSGFTITGGDGQRISGRHHGGGIYVDEASPLIEHCMIRNNGNRTASLAGGGIFAAGAGALVRLRSCYFDSNGSNSSAGGAIYCSAGAQVIGSRLKLRGNASSSKGAVHATDALLSLTECHFSRQYFLAIQAVDSELDLDGCRLYGQASYALDLVNSQTMIRDTEIIWPSRRTRVCASSTPTSAAIGPAPAISMPTLSFLRPTEAPVSSAPILPRSMLAIQLPPMRFPTGIHCGLAATRMDRAPIWESSAAR